MEVFVMYEDAYRTYRFAERVERIVIGHPSSGQRGAEGCVWGFIGERQVFAKLVRTDPPMSFAAGGSEL